MYASKGQEVVAIVMEPILGEGGDVEISGYFANGIRRITKERGIYMICDEVQTGVATTGTFWAHEQWDLESPPDFVTFAKKMQAAGFFHSDETKLEQPMRHFNTFMGDAVRVKLAATMNELIERDNLVENAKETGAYLKQGLEAASEKYPLWIKNVRGKGTFIAFDSETSKHRDTLTAALRKNGVN